MKNKFETASSPTTCPLLAVPIDIRYLIYRILFPLPDPDFFIIRSARKDSHAQPLIQHINFLLTCRQIYKECQPLAFASIVWHPATNQPLCNTGLGDYLIHRIRTTTSAEALSHVRHISLGGQILTYMLFEMRQPGNVSSIGRLPLPNLRTIVLRTPLITDIVDLIVEAVAVGYEKLERVIFRMNNETSCHLKECKSYVGCSLSTKCVALRRTMLHIERERINFAFKRSRISQMIRGERLCWSGVEFVHLLSLSGERFVGCIGVVRRGEGVRHVHVILGVDDEVRSVLESPWKNSCPA